MHHLCLLAFGNITTRLVFTWDSGTAGGWLGVVDGEREVVNGTPEALDYVMHVMKRNVREQQEIVDNALNLGQYQGPARPRVHYVFLIVRESRAGAHVVSVNLGVGETGEVYGKPSLPSPTSNFLKSPHLCAFLPRRHLCRS